MRGGSGQHGELHIHRHCTGYPRLLQRGTQGDLQIEMGLYGAVIVLPAVVPANCASGYHALNLTAKIYVGRIRFPAVASGIRSPRELLRPGIPSSSGRRWIHVFTEQAEAEVMAKLGCTAGAIRMQPRCANQALSSCVFPHQWHAFHA